MPSVRPRCSALRTDQVRDVATVNGETPLAAAGPGEPVDFVPLGTGDFDDIAPAELGVGAAQAMAVRLGGSEDALAALGQPVPDGRRGFAFVRSGCAETGAVLLVSHETITAELTGGEDTNCDAPAYFLLTFTIARDDVPPAAELS